MPIGILIINIKGQLKCSIIKPPTVGPNVGPSTNPIPNQPEAIGLSCGSNASNKIACEVESNAPPPTPCINRHATISTRPVDCAHIYDANVKMIIEAM